MSNREVEFLNELNSAGIKYEAVNNLFRITEPGKLSGNQIMRFAQLDNRKLIKATKAN